MNSEKQQIRDSVAKRFFEEKLEDIRHSFSPEHIILFGSRASGRPRPNSDLDLIVVSDRFRDVPYPNRMGAFLRAIRPIPDVEAFCYTPEEFEIMRKRIGVIADAAREGIWIQ